MGLHLPDSGEGEVDRGPVGGFGGRIRTLTPPAFQVGWNGYFHLLGMRKAEIFHVADEVVLAQRSAQTRIEPALLSDTGDREPAIVMPRIENAGAGQREDSLLHGTVQGV